MKKHLTNTPLFVIPAIVAAATLTWLELGSRREPLATAEGKATAVRGSQSAKNHATQHGSGESGNHGGAAQPSSDAVGAEHTRRVQLLTSKIQEALQRFKSGELSEDEARALLDELGQALRAAGGKAAGAAIMAFLNSGEDAATGLEFRVGERGVLEEAPTLRTAMLDQLGQLSAKDAMEHAQKIFAQARNADEWALNLRNLAWNNDDKRFSPELQRRLEQMLDRAEWAQAPSAGFLEAFDIAVHLGGAQQVANMASMLGPNLEGALDQAAFLSLDRLTLREPGVVFDSMRKDPTLMSSSPEVRAAIMARATEPDTALQKQALEAYMLNPQTSTEEFQNFAELFPLRSMHLGERLATAQERLPGLSEMANADIRALETVRQWLGDSRFATRHAELRGVEQRLVEYQSQIEAARREGSLK